MGLFACNFPKNVVEGGCCVLVYILKSGKYNKVFVCFSELYEVCPQFTFGVQGTPHFDSCGCSQVTKHSKYCMWA